MDLENSFTVQAEVEPDAQRVPGVSLQSVNGDAFSGNVKVKFGAASLACAGEARFVNIDREPSRWA